jgi:16S rRNA (uracil1498-N3)-methyltransferase
VSAPHFFVPPLPLEPSLVELTEDDSRHALRSLRLKAGDPMTVTDGEGRVGEGTLVRVDRGRAVVEVARVREVAHPRPAVAVVVAPPKGERLRWMVQKLAEIGADALLLEEGERSVRTLPDDRAEGAVRRLESVAREAAMQAHRPFLMQVGIRRERSPSAGLTLVLHVDANRRLTEVLPDQPPEALTLAVGPEGGFAEAEVADAERAGSLVASLGSNVLRTETAAVVAAALTLARYGRLG